jgi:dihydrofolate synthase/folylpolyglutamate synthase
VENALAVLKTVEALRAVGHRIPDDAMTEGIATVSWPGRLEMIKTEGATVLLDGAHNLAGARVLRQYLDEFGRKPITLVFGVMRDKRISEMAAELFPLAETIILTRADDERAADLSFLVERLGTSERTMSVGDSAAAFSRAERITPNHGMICVTGSLYLVGEAKQWLEAQVSDVRSSSQGLPSV